MIEAFETIVDATLLDEDFDNLLVEENNVALLAERVSSWHKNYSSYTLIND